jgi:hypothetical protein
MIHMEGPVIVDYISAKFNTNFSIPMKRCNFLYSEIFAWAIIATSVKLLLNLGLYVRLD